VWELADTAIALMCIPNLLSLWLLRGEVFSLTAKYLKEELLEAARKDKKLYKAAE